MIVTKVWLNSTVILSQNAKFINFLQIFRVINIILNTDSFVPRNLKVLCDITPWPVRKSHKFFAHKLLYKKIYINLIILHYEMVPNFYTHLERKP